MTSPQAAEQPGQTEAYERSWPGNMPADSAGAGKAWSTAARPQPPSVANDMVKPAASRNCRRFQVAASAAEVGPLPIGDGSRGLCWLVSKVFDRLVIAARRAILVVTHRAIGGGLNWPTVHAILGCITVAVDAPAHR